MQKKEREIETVDDKKVRLNTTRNKHVLRLEFEICIHVYEKKNHKTNTVLKKLYSVDKRCTVTHYPILHSFSNETADRQLQ